MDIKTDHRGNCINFDTNPRLFASVSISVSLDSQAVIAEWQTAIVMEAAGGLGERYELTYQG